MIITLIHDDHLNCCTAVQGQEQFPHINFGHAYSYGEDGGQLHAFIPGKKIFRGFPPQDRNVTEMK